MMDSAQRNFIHKVWRYKGSERLVESGCFIAMPRLDILDLTKSDTITAIIEENQEATSAPYEIISNSIVVKNQNNDVHTEFKISKLTDNELRLIVHGNWKNSDGKTVEADIIEMTFDDANKLK